MQFYGYKHIAGKAQMFTINNPALGDLWAQADTAQRRRLIEKMKIQGKLDFVAYKEAQDLQGAVIDWIIGKKPTDKYGVVIL